MVSEAEHTTEVALHNRSDLLEVRALVVETEQVPTPMKSSARMLILQVGSSQLAEAELQSQHVADPV